MTAENKTKNSSTKDKNDGKVEKYGFGIRHIQCLCVFLGLAIAYSLRVNLFIAIVAMTDKNAGNYNNYKIFDWKENVRGLLKSSFYWGYVVTQLPGGQLSKQYGAKYFLLFGVLIPSVLTVLTPVVTTIGDWPALIALRVFEGFCQGLLFPSVHTFLAQWVPVEERSRLGMFCYSGVMFGTALIIAISGSIATSALGWPGIFYISGAAGIVWSIIWYLFGVSRPSEHRKISIEERQYIEKSLGICEEFHAKNIPTPWLKILTSKRFHALIATVIAQAWGFVVLLTQIPSYMHAVFKVEIDNNAIMSSAPYFVMWMLSYVFVFIGDFLYERELMPVAGLRKMFNTIGSCIPAMALIGLAFITNQQITLAVGLLILAVGMNAACGIGHALNHIDLAPYHAGIMMGITNGISGLINVISPIAVSAIVTNDTDQSQWQIVFFISAAIFFIGNLIFVIFGSADEQEWNGPMEEKKFPTSRNHRRSSAFVEGISISY